ncbi:MAG: outer membrane homotrimeric porin [Desulfovibrionaceae bacterium]|nr:outer membrane homotrimeric porin [Desulfovibrionaceae bacterium]
MKRLLILLAVAALVLGSGLQAGAAIKFGATGHVDSAIMFNNNTDDFNSETKDDNTQHVTAATRLRATVSAEGSEYAKAHYQFQVGNYEWGRDGGGGLSTDGQDFKTRLLWANVHVPNTPVAVSAGLLYLALPSAVAGNPVFGDRVGGVILGAQLADPANLSLFWARPRFSEEFPSGSGISAINNHNTIDMFGGILALNLDQVEVSPYLVYGRAGANSDPDADFTWTGGDEAKIFVGGAAVTYNPIEPLTLMLDAIYGSAKNSAKDKSGETSGFMAALGADYSLPFGTPGLRAWYASGMDKDGNGVLPVIGADDGVTFTRLGSYGTASLAMEGIVSTSMVGTMGVAAQIQDVSFVDKLTHMARIAYYKGLNDKEFTGSALYGDTYMGIHEGASFIELNLDTTYNIVDNISSVLEIGYIVPSFSNDAKPLNGDKADPAFNTNLYLRFVF